eukprot:174532-Rhodomonas_salina.1
MPCPGLPLTARCGRTAALVGVRAEEERQRAPALRRLPQRTRPLRALCSNQRERQSARGSERERARERGRGRERERGRCGCWGCGEAGCTLTGTPHAPSLAHRSDEAAVASGWCKLCCGRRIPGLHLGGTPLHSVEPASAACWSSPPTFP